MSFKLVHFYSFRNINVVLFLSDKSPYLFAANTACLSPHIGEAVSGDWVNG